MEEKKKRKRRTKAEMKAEYQSIINFNYFDDGIYSGKYIGQDILGFKHGKTYVFKLKHPFNECYQLSEIEENLFITYASSISIRQNWKDIKGE